MRTSGKPSWAATTFASLSHYNYRLFFCGTLISTIGTWLGRTAQSWLVLMVLTAHSATALGNVTALQFGPMLFLAPLGGVLADRYSKRRLLLITQTLLGLQQLTQWILVATGICQLWHVYLLSFLMAGITAVDNPTRQSFASEMVGPELLSNAVGLNAAAFNTARLIGPAVAGLLISWLGVGPAFLINAV
ncbi:MAG: MFS transporter, partial [Propionibacteriaceae bacterium]